MVSQLFEGRRRAVLLDLPRMSRNAALGFALHGPMLHFWIEAMEGPIATFAGGNEEKLAIFLKIALDQTVFTTAINLAYATLDGLLADQTPSEAFARARQVLVPSVVASWRFWPFVHLLSYSSLIPIEFKLLWIDTMEIAWVAILSSTVNAKPSDKASIKPAYTAAAEETETVIPWGEGRFKQIKARSEVFAAWLADNSPSFEHEER